MHLIADISVSDEFQNVNTFILDWRLLYCCNIKTNEVTKDKRYQIILCIIAWWEVLAS